MQASIAQPDVVLTWSLQTALSGGLTVACIALALTFGRPAMRVVATYFMLGTIASVLIWMSLAARSLGLPPLTGSILASFALPVSPLLAFVLALHLLRIIAGRTTRAFPSAARLAATGIGGLMAGLTIAWLTTSPSGGSAPVVAVIGSIAAVFCHATVTIVAFRMRKQAPEHRNPLGFVGAAFAVFTVRSVTNIAVSAASVASGTPPHFSLPVTIAQVFLLVVGGVMLIIAVLDEERASIIHSAEQIRYAEAAMATSQRLESLGRMAGAVAHDFNNVLAVIGMSAESARTGTADEREDDLREIQSSSKRGQELTRQLLAFARQTPQQISRFDVSHQVEKLSGLLNRLVGKQVALSITLSPTPQIVEMDVTQFEQVLMNLAVNARDAMPRGGTIVVKVGSSVTAGDSKAGFAHLSVADSGSGIPADVLPHIFEPFFSTKTVGEGTGLGLATCDGIVRRSGGRIDVHTEAGKGTRFDVLLPRTSAA